MNGIEVVDTTGDPAFAVDVEGKIIAWNKAAEYCLGHRRSEVIGRHCWRVLRGRDLCSNRYCDKTCPIRNMALQGEPVNRTEMFFRNASGERARFGMSTFVLGAGVSQEIVHLLQPVTAREGASAESSGPAGNNSRLSSRQLEVLRYLGEGKGTRKIAEELGLSPATVRHHVQHILERLKVHSRLEAVALARRIGLL